MPSMDEEKDWQINILVLYYSVDYPLRANVRDHLYCFRDHHCCRCYYLNLAVWKLPSFLERIPFDLIVFHTLFLSARWTPGYFYKLLNRVRPVTKFQAVRVAFPQDEFYGTRYLDEFITEFKLQVIYSVAPESEWDKIYPNIDPDKTRIFPVLTGYLNPSTVERIERLRNKMGDKRLIDIGYRAWKAEPWLGRHGFNKLIIADLFHEHAKKYGLKTDISTRQEDTFWGDDWYRFLLSCKYTIGVEGGAGILDPDGSIRNNTNAYVAAHPDASFDEVEAACFPGLDGSLNLFAISPRHLEACATRTCQVLVEGNYGGLLKKDEHYIELKKDFSNIEDVMLSLTQDHLRESLTEQAYQDLVLSGRCTYSGLVDYVLKTALKGASTGEKQVSGWIIYDCLLVMDHLAWAVAAVTGFIKRRLPEKLVQRIKRRIAGT